MSKNSLVLVFQNKQENPMIDMAKIQMTMARKTKERAIQSPGITIIGEGLTERFYFYLLPLLGW